VPGPDLNGSAGPGTPLHRAKESTMTMSVRQARRPASVPRRRTASRRAVPGWAVTLAAALGALAIAAVALLTGGQRHTGATPVALPPPPTAVVAEING